MTTHSLSLALLAVGLTLPAARAADKVTLDDLLKQMTDLSKLAEYPDPPYVTKQFSSYDRASQTPGNENWFANADRGFMLYDGVVKDEDALLPRPRAGDGPDGFFAAGTKVGLAPTHKPVGDFVWAYATGPDGRPIDGKTPQGYIDRNAFTPDPQGHVLAEMDGPGCVVRIWSADPDDAGKIRIYLDEAKEPIIEAPLTDLLGGKWKTNDRRQKLDAFPRPDRLRTVARLQPVFPHRLRQTLQDHHRQTGHLLPRRLPDLPEGDGGGDIHPGSPARTSLNWNPRIDFHGPPNLKAATPPGGGMYESPVLTVAPGSYKELFHREGDRPQRINSLQIKLPGAADAEVLRGLVLIAKFDGAKEPQIWCPLGDFFGSAPGVNPYQSMPFAVSREKDGVTLSCSWCMPFQKSAFFEIHNFGVREVSVQCSGYFLPLYQWTDRSMHFHAKWRTADMKTRPFHDWTYCDLKGQGVFVGDMLSIMSPVAAWWGEGDEKIFVDGEKFPSWFGTGSEDYYGYAWSNPEPFQHPYHNQTRCDGKGTGGTFGLTSVNRFHILDNVPFEKSFRFDMECWHWDPNVTVNYAATSYWYARPGATDDFEPVDAKVLQNIPAPPPPPPPFKIKGALEGETLKVLGKSSDFPLGPQDMRPFSEGKWSNESHLWGRPNKAGEFVDLALPVAADGKYQVIVYLTKARDYGVVQFSLDGKALGKPIDCFEPVKVLATGPIDLGTVELKKGDAVLRLEVTGTNEKSVGVRYMFGLDCVVLKPE